MIRTPMQTSRPRGLSTTADQDMPQTGGFNYILKSGAPARLYWPKWGGKDNAIRILPQEDPENPGNFEPTRVVDDISGETVLGNWICRYPAIKFFGNPGVTMLLDRTDADERELQAVNPFWVIRRAVERAIKNRVDKPGWASLVTGKMCAFPKPGSVYFVQSFVFVNDSKPTFSFSRDPSRAKPPIGARADGPVVVYQLPYSAGNALIKVMRHAADKGGSTGQCDPVAVHPGAFVHVFEKGTDPLGMMGYGDDPDAGVASMYSGTGGGGGDSEGFAGKSYDVVLTDTLDGKPSNPVRPTLRGQEKIVLGKVKPWDALLDVKSYDEQLLVICKCFLLCQDVQQKDIFVDVLRYAYGDRPDLLSEEVRDYGRAFTAVPTLVPQPQRKKTPPVTAHPAPVEEVGVTNEADDLASSLYNQAYKESDEERPATSATTAPVGTSSGSVLQPGPSAPAAVVLPAQEAAKAAMDRALASARARREVANV